MYKKLLIFLLLPFFLLSCFDSQEEKKDGLMEKSYENFSMRVPKNWEILEKDNTILPSPYSWVIELAATSKLLKNNFANTLIVMSEDIPEPISSKEYSDMNYLWAEKDYHTFLDISSDIVKFWEENMSSLHIFEAKYNVDSPRLKFLQASVVCPENKGYNLTLAIPSSITDTVKYEYLLSTFRCK